MNTTVKIPVELSGVEAQVKFLKDALNNIKPDTRGYKDLSRVLATIQHEFDAIKAAANGSFGSQSQINAFSKKVQDLGNQMSLFATKFEDLGDKSFKTDFLPDSVVKNLKDMTMEMNNLLKSMAQLKSDAFSKSLSGSENAIKSLASLKLTGKEDPSYIMNKLDVAIKKADGNIAKATQDLASQKEQVKTLRDEYDALNAAKNKKQNENLGLNNAVQAKTLELSKQIATNEQNRQKAIADATKLYDEQIAKLTVLNRAVGKGGHMTNEQRQSNTLLDGAFSAGKGDFMSNRENIATFMKTNFHIDDATVEQIKAGNKAQVEAIVSDVLTQVQATREKVIQATAVTDVYDSEALQSTKNEINELEQKLARVRTEAETIIRGTATKEREVNAAAEQEARLQNNLRSQQQLRESYAATRTEVEAAAVAAQEAADGSGIAQQIDVLRSKITALESEISKLNQEQKNTVNATAQSQDGINNMGNAASVASAKLAQLEAAQNRLNNIKTAIASWLGFNQIINITRTTVRNMINHIKELDDVMTEIAVVTDFTQDDLWKQMDTYASIAREYGVSIKGVYEVSQLYYQQGLKQADVMALTTETLKMAKIAGLSYKDAADYMTVAIRGFNMEMTEAQRITDVYSKVAAITATDTQELAEAMSKTASSASSVGASFENTTAIMATMQEATRESSKNIGTALKSIISRYGELKSDPRLLLDSEGEELSLNKVDKALQSVGITLQTADGQFRDFDEVIIELASHWGELDSISQRY